MLLKRMQVALETEHTVTDIGFRIAENRDPLPAMLDQIVTHLLGFHAIIDRHIGICVKFLPVRNRHRAEHKRDRQTIQTFHRLHRITTEEDDAVQPLLLLEQRRHFGLILLLLDVLEHQGVIMRRARLLKHLDHAREEGVRDALHEHGDVPGVVQLQVPRRVVRHVAILIDDLLYPALRLRTDVIVVIDRPRHGRHTDARQFGNFLDCQFLRCHSFLLSDILTFRSMPEAITPAQRPAPGSLPAALTLLRHSPDLLRAFLRKIFLYKTEGPVLSER